MKTEEARKVRIMSNSSLVTYRDWSPHYDNQRSRITDITIHHMAGNLSLQACGRTFHVRQASAHYGITSQGAIGQYVDESHTAWANANWYSNLRSVTIELANDQIGGNWHVSDKAIEACINLCVDICKRNGIKALNYTGTTSGNLTRHNMFCSTTCPGPYLQSKFPYIASEVNKRLKSTPEKLVVDGILGKKSIARAQEWFGCAYRDGVLSAQLYSLRSYFPALQSVTWGKNGSSSVVTIQEFLKSKGYDPGEIDGLLGYKTILALQKFLKAKGFNPGTLDGILGTNTAIALQKFLNAR